MNFALGGGFNGRLNIISVKIRLDLWCPVARFTGDEYAGEYYFSSGIRANATDSALSETMKEIKNYF